MKIRRPMIAVVVLAAAAQIVATRAIAETRTFQYHQNAAGFCQSALPVFEGSIRKRPTAIANEGTANVFVSCSMVTAPHISTTNIPSIGLGFANRGGVAAEVTCTFVHGANSGTGTAVPRTVTVAAGSSSGIGWNGADVAPATRIAYGNFSCNLPAGVEITSGQYLYQYEIGS